MKLRSTTPASHSLVTRLTLVLFIAVMAFAIPLQLSSTTANADQYDAQIEALKRRVSGYQEEANRLRKEADTLQNTLAELAADRAAIQAEIDLQQTEYDRLVEEIAETEARIEENRRISGELIVSSAISGDIPLIVRLAASENLADYIEGEANLISVRDDIVKRTAEIEDLKEQLEEKQAKVKKVLDEQTQKRNELASKEGVQRDLLRQTEGDEQAYQEMIADSREEIKRVQAEQQAAYERARAAWSGGYITSGGSGGYPWGGVPYPCWSASCADPWGLYYRECTSYVAWKLNSQGYGVKHFNGRGHAGDWPSTTAGYTSQRVGVANVGDAAVIPFGGNFPYGHVMYVESVNSDDSITISEYNFAGPGIYSERTIPKSQYSYYTFITFPRR